jgi:hypothetical protein
VKLDMGKGPNDETNTEQTDPKKAPVYTLRVKGFCQIGVTLCAEGSSKIAIPKWAKGAVLLMQIGGERPKSEDDLPSIELKTRAHHIIQIKPSDSGKMAYISYQWQNGKGEKGPPAPMQMIRLP